mmetsp:Transcript_11976/g.20793  ORF Transcript_11976/g.20793 Transcript_11976/m.20793 type:complete len:128 (-) Transcript_11976:519-902(-)
MVNSLELAYQLRRISIESGSSVPPPPDMISIMSCSTTSSSSQEFELDCSRFDSISPSPSFASSVGSFPSANYEKQQGMIGGLSRSRCAHNLSALCSSSSAGSTSSSRQMFESGPNEGWGYYVDTPRR